MRGLRALGLGTLGIGLLAGDHPLDVLEDLPGIEVVDAATLNGIEVHLLVEGEVPVEFNGLCQLDDIVRDVRRRIVLLLLEPNDHDLLALLPDGPPHECPAVGEGVHSLGAANKDQLMILWILNEHRLLNEVLEGVVALVIGEAEVGDVLQRVAGVALDQEVLEDAHRQTTSEFIGGALGLLQLPTERSEALQLLPIDEERATHTIVHRVTDAVICEEAVFKGSLVPHAIEFEEVSSNILALATL